MVTHLHLYDVQRRATSTTIRRLDAVIDGHFRRMKRGELVDLPRGCASGRGVTECGGGLTRRMFNRWGWKRPEAVGWPSVKQSLNVKKTGDQQELPQHADDVGRPRRSTS